MSDKSGTSEQVISLPKGGGALRGIGEKFSPDLHTGTGNFTVPIALPPGRNGFQPDLSLVYSTGNGNGPFGLGWDLSIPGVTRKTSKGVPQYPSERAPRQERDVFVLSGAEDLVPVEETGRFTRYRPRTESLFARIVHHHTAGDDYWEVRGKDGIVSYYGMPGRDGDDPPVIADPDPLRRRRIFAWRLTRTEDPFGNRIDYSYRRDLGSQGLRRWDQLYLEQIRYVDYEKDGETRYLVSVSFDYQPRGDAFSDYRAGGDAFSDYRAGFEIRTRLRCTGIHVRLHHDRDIPSRTYQLVYLDQRQDLADLESLLPLNGVSLLSRVQVVGYDDAGNPYDGKVHDGQLREHQLPPLDLGYTRFQPATRRFQALDDESLPTRSLASSDLELADLSGNGLPDIVEMNGTARYWRNLGGGRFDLPRPMHQFPSGISLAKPGVQLLDADGDGRIDLLATQDGLAGYFPLDSRGEWDRRSFRRHAHAPSFNLEDPEVELVDIDGDGVVDAVRSGTRLEVFYNYPRQGWDPERTTQIERRALEVFPNVSFADPRVRWADMSGDGLQDIVLVYDGNVEYWPNLGHGNWAPRIHMRNSPQLPYGYDPRRVLLGDVDGDGLADLVFVDHDRVLLWINQSGNAWSDPPIPIAGTPPVTDTDAVRLEDLLGSGMRGLLWSTDATSPGRPHLFFLDFAGTSRPCLLDRVDNHLGAVTRVAYASSTEDYLADKARPETRWKTSLPFPVQTVRQVETIDLISGSKLTSQYSYHHGCWDGAEREHRNFGMVEQLDTETLADYNTAGLHGPDTPFVPVDEQRFSPPTLTRTWFRLGPTGEEFGAWAEPWSGSEDLPGRWSGDGSLLAGFPEVAGFVNGLPRRAKRDALRALRGTILRTELYALDGTARQDRPYTVTEALYGVCEVVDEPHGTQRLRCAPPAGDDGASQGYDLPPRVFFPYRSAERITRWDRGDDPMTRFTFASGYDKSGQFVSGYDAYGQPERSTTIACPRGWRAMTDTPTAPYLATRTRTEYARVSDPQVFIKDRVSRTTTWEITSSAGHTVPALRDLPDTHARLEAIGQTLNYFDRAARPPGTGAFQGLPFGQVGRYGALARTETLVLTGAILKAAYGRDPPPYLDHSQAPGWTGEYPAGFRSRLASLPGLAGYHYRPGGDHVPGYFAATERRRYDFHDDPGGHGRGLLLARRDPLGKQTTIAYDTYGLLPIEVRLVLDPDQPRGDALVTWAHYNYRVLQPKRSIDPNGNHTEFAFSPIGLLREVWLKGKDDPRHPEGDHGAPSTVIEHDLLAFHRSPPSHRQPIFVRSVRRLHHDTERDVPKPGRDETQETREYSDGFGRLVQTRKQAETVRFGDPLVGGGEAILPARQDDGPGADVAGQENTDPTRPNVAVSGWQVYDNKGRVIEKYEPLFAVGWDYQPPSAATLQRARKASMFYDPRGQPIRTLNPDGSEQRVVNGIPADLARPDAYTPTPWETYTYDANDLAPVSTAPDGSSLALAAPQEHHYTPSSVEVDALGRVVKTTERNGPDPATEWHTTTFAYDLRGNLLAVRDALGHQTFATYDLADRRLRAVSPAAGDRRVVLDAAGNILETRDGRDAVTLHAYDGLHRLVSLWARDRGDEPVTLRQRLVYGEESGLALRPDQNLRGQVYQHFDEAGLVIFGRYDFKGNLLDKQRRTVRDEILLTPFNSPPAGWAVRPFRADWDTHDLSILDPPLSVDYAYDALNRIKHVRCPRDGDGNRRVLRPTYNRAGLLERVDLDGETYLEHIAYDARGERVLVAYGNGVMARYARDPRTFLLRRLRTERYTKPGPRTYRRLTGLPAPERVFQDFAYGYDLAGNLVELHDRTPGSGTPPQPDRLDRRFTHDPLYRLRTASGRECASPPPARPWTDAFRCQDPTATRSYQQTYAYDRVGNLESLRHTAGTGSFTRTLHLVAGSDRLQRLEVGAGTSAWQYTHDDNGNLTGEGRARHLEWDHADRLRAYRTQTPGAAPTVHATYLYDASGQRVKKLVRKGPGTWQATVYLDGIFEAHRLVRPNRTWHNNILHVLDGPRRLAEVRVGDPLPGDGARGVTVRYTLEDHLGSSNVTVGGADATANRFIRREEFTPYGETSLGSFGRKRYRFHGKERDEESALYYFGARYYAPWIARFISCDPAGGVDGNNLYLAFGNNPLRFRDLQGHQKQETTQSSAGAQAWSRRVTGTCPDVPSQVDLGSQGPSISADTRTPEERFADEQWTRHVEDHIKQYGHAPTKLELLAENLRKYTETRNPLAWLSQFATEKNMPSYEPPGSAATYVRGAPTFLSPTSSPTSRVLNTPPAISGYENITGTRVPPDAIPNGTNWRLTYLLPETALYAVGPVWKAGTLVRWATSTKSSEYLANYQIDVLEFYGKDPSGTPVLAGGPGEPVHGFTGMGLYEFTTTIGGGRWALESRVATQPGAGLPNPGATQIYAPEGLGPAQKQELRYIIKGQYP